MDSLRRRGMLVLFGAASGPVPPVDPQRLNAGGSLYLTRPTLFHHIATREELLSTAEQCLRGGRRGPTGRPHRAPLRRSTRRARRTRTSRPAGRRANWCSFRDRAGVTCRPSRTSPGWRASPCRPDGARLVTTVATPDPEAHPLPHRAVGDRPGGRAARAQADPGHRASPGPRSSPTATCSSPPPGPTPTEGSPTRDAPAALWRLPTAGEAHVVGTRAGGIDAPAVARDAGTVVVSAMTLPRRRHRRGRRGPPQGPQGRRRSTRSCTPRTRCGTGTTTSARTSERLLVGRRARRRHDRLARPHPDTRPGPSARSRSPRTARRSSPSGRCPSGTAAAARRWWSSTSRPVSGGRCSTTPPPTSWRPRSAPTAPASPACGRRVPTATAPIDRILLVVPLAGGAPHEVAAAAGTAGPRSSAGWATRSSSPPTTGAAARCSA